MALDQITSTSSHLHQSLSEFGEQLSAYYKGSVRVSPVWSIDQNNLFSVYCLPPLHSTPAINLAELASEISGISQIGIFLVTMMQLNYIIVI